VFVTPAALQAYVDFLLCLNKVVCFTEGQMWKDNAGSLKQEDLGIFKRLFFLLVKATLLVDILLSVRQVYVLILTTTHVNYTRL